MWNVKDVHLSYMIATLETEHSLVYVGVLCCAVATWIPCGNRWMGAQPGLQTKMSLQTCIQSKVDI